MSAERYHHGRYGFKRSSRDFVVGKAVGETTRQDFLSSDHSQQPNQRCATPLVY